MKDIPDCVSNCPLMYDDFDEETAASICEECFLNDDEYFELTSHTELYGMAVDYLARYEVGLQDLEMEYTERQKTAIMFTSQEIRRQQNEKIEKDREKAESERKR